MSGIVTGAASGIGAAVTRMLFGEGARVVASDIAAGPLEAFTASLAAQGEAVPAVADVRQFAQLEQVAATCQERFGRIDFVVANAGLVDAGTMADGDPERWRAVLETNLLGVAYTVRAVLPTMLAQNDGHIVLLASVSGRVAYVGEPIYAASKWGVVGLGHSLRKETVNTGVRVTLIEPGMVDTPLTRANPFAQEWMKTMSPLQDDDIARAITFALSQPKYMAINELTLRPIAQEH
jgi:NADP-dependent 3-hydroxy acid dehydrogenase YdfG